MFKIEQTEKALTCEISSRANFVDRAIQELEAFVTGLEGPCPTTDLALAVRELLINAMEHGNGGDATRTIRLSIEQVAPARYKVEVHDQGPGLAAAALLPRAELQPGQTRQRGLAIVTSCSDLVEPGGQGTIRAWFTICRETEFETEIVDSEWMLRPTGDITSTVAEPFRKVLISWFESEREHLCLDLAKVENIDSICLSILVSLSHMKGIREGLRQVRLTHPSPGLERLFRLTRLHAIFKI